MRTASVKVVCPSIFMIEMALGQESGVSCCSAWMINIQHLHIQNLIHLLTLEYSFQRQIDHGWAIVILFPFQNGEIRLDQHHVWECHHQTTVKLAQPIERDINLVPCFIKRHRVLVRINDLLDVLVVVVSPNQVTLLGLNLVNLLFKPEAIKDGANTRLTRLRWSVTTPP